MKLKKLISIILIIMLIIYMTLSFSPVGSIESNAAQGTPGVLTRDIDSLDDTLYPGYKSLIKSMQASHSNYTFLLYYTGIDWNEALVAEYQGHGVSPVNLVQVSTNYNGMWICPICGNTTYDNGSWCCASLEALAYMMDPRNSINDTDIFQFKDLEGSDVTYDDIARVVANYGSYINNAEAIQAIVDASNLYNVNGYFLVAKIINEHGSSGSTLVNGTGYNGNYVGYYNYFNIGSYGSGTSTIINSGLSYAQTQGWNSIRASILGGASVVKNSYITTYSQNTLYYQKYNVSGKSSMASHQYQQNILAAQTQGTSLKSYYSDLNSSEFVFIIPVYENMPTTTASRPSTTTSNTISYEEGVVQNVSKSLTVRASANGTAIGALNNGESIKILQRATTQVNGYYWDLIVSNQDGTYGYAARIVGGDTLLVSTGSSGSSGTSTSSGTSSSSSSTTSTTTTSSGSIAISGSYINTLPSINYSEIISTYSNAVVTNSSGETVTSGSLGTGYKVTVNGTTYTVVKKGDVNGDGSVSVGDAIIMLNAVKGTTTLSNEYLQAACVKNESTFNVGDVISLLNYIKGTASLSL